MAKSTANLTFLAAFLLLSLVKADWDGGWGHRGNGDWDGEGNPWWGDGEDDDNDDDNNGNGTAETTNGYGLGSFQDFNTANKVLIAHAVIASLVWVMFIPTGAILLRLGLKNPIILKLHAGLQILSYLFFIVAAGLGIWLAQQTAEFGTWDDPHPRLGLAILVIAFPIFGVVHHLIFKKRAAAVKEGKPTKPPGRTLIGRMHLWVGRSLIVLGIVNGGLGIRLASFSPFQTDETTRKAKIAYGVVAGFMLTLYAVLVITFEIRRKRAQKNMPAAPAAGTAHGDQVLKLPSYDESQSDESLRREGYATSRYH